MSDVRDTSIEAYIAEVDSGRLASKRDKIFKIIKHKFNMNPFTPKQLANECASFGFKETWKVISDLKNREALEESHKALCPISGRRVYWVKMTGKTPSNTIAPRKPRGLSKSVEYILNHMNKEHLMTINRAQLISLK